MPGKESKGILSLNYNPISDVAWKQESDHLWLSAEKVLLIC